MGALCTKDYAATPEPERIMRGGPGSTPPPNHPYSPAEVRQHWIKLTPKLSIAQMQPGNVIKLSGLSGWFDEAPLLNPDWMQGRMTSDEYVRLIAAVNEITTRGYMGQSKPQYRPDEPNLFSEDQVTICCEAIRAYIKTESSWWKVNRGINIAFSQQSALITQRYSAHNSKYIYPCELLFAILDQPIPVVPAQILSSSYADSGIHPSAPVPPPSYTLMDGR